MSEPTTPTFAREAAAVLAARLAEPRRFVQVVAGPRQVGKTTLVQQLLAKGGRANLRKYGYPPDKQEKATRTVLEQAEVLSEGWAVG